MKTGISKTVSGLMDQKEKRHKGKRAKNTYV